jgi:hypothetical protein
MWENRNAYRLLVGKPEGKRPLGRPRLWWVDNIRMDLGEVGWGDVDWSCLAVKNMIRNFMYVVTNFILGQSSHLGAGHHLYGLFINITIVMLMFTKSQKRTTSVICCLSWYSYTHESDGQIYTLTYFRMQFS